MNIEDRIFSKCKIDNNRLLEYGFRKENNEYRYTKNLTDGFDMLVTYDSKLSVKVFDIELNEEYLNYRYTNQGSFAYEIASKVEEELIKIKDHISSSLNYKSEQANYVDEYMGAVYGKVDFTFKDNPNVGVYRESGDDKWYAIIMKISKRKLDENLPDEETEIINLKVEKKKLNSLLKKKGIYPAYHMNKQNWVSVILDNSISDVDLILMINESYNLVEKSKNEKKFYYKKY